MADFSAICHDGSLLNSLPVGDTGSVDTVLKNEPLRRAYLALRKYEVSATNEASFLLFALLYFIVPCIIGVFDDQTDTKDTNNMSPDVNYSRNVAESVTSLPPRAKRNVHRAGGRKPLNFFHSFNG